MGAFLHQLAQAIWRQHGTALREVAVVLPSQRAGLYLHKWLAQVAGKPLWSPQMFTMGSFMETLSGLRPLATEELLFEGYEAFRKAEGAHAQGIGDFMQWGSTTLADISEADAYGVDLDSYYRDLRSWEELDITFNHDPLSRGQERMVRYWAMVGRMHRLLNEQLMAMGAGTTGLIERTAAQRLAEQGHRWEAVWFAGLNALTRSQHNVLSQFKLQGKAHFAWDADRYYLERNEQEAGQHLRKAMAAFGPGTVPVADSLAGAGKRLQAVRAPNDVAQAWVAAELLKNTPATERARTAVVLADESLLVLLLEALPPDIGPLNITMGLAVAQLPVGSYLDALHRLYTGMRAGHGFFLGDIERFLGHPFLAARNGPGAVAAALKAVHAEGRAYHGAGALQAIMAGAQLPAAAVSVFAELHDVRGQLPQITAKALAWAKENMAGDPFVTEQIYQASLVVRRVHLLLGRYGHQLDIQAYATLFQRLLRAARIGFYGEPLAGVQVMGMLEARALDFERLVLVGVQEGTLPANTSERSFIPFELRRHHGMMLRDANDAVQAYNFMRMLQRAEDATLTWAEGEEAQGPSRFILQLQHELFRGHGRELPVLDARVPLPPTVEKRIVSVRKDAAVLQALRKRLGRGLTPSALGEWLSCPLSFHFKQVMGLSEIESFSSRIAPNILGAALHNAVESLYGPYLGRPLQPADLAPGLESIGAQLRNELLKHVSAEQLGTGEPMLQYHMATRAAQRFVRAELHSLEDGQVLTVLEQESDLAMELAPASAEIGTPVVIKGRLDRVDRADGVLRILDMKTGKVNLPSLHLKELDLQELKRGDKRYAAQLLVYAWLYLNQHPEVQEVQAGLLPLQHAESNKPVMLSIGKNRSITRGQLPGITELLCTVVREMMDPQVPVEHDPESKFCVFCLA